MYVAIGKIVNWKDLQPLRVANGWSIDINNLYQFDLNENNLDWYYSEFLLCAIHRQKKICFDSSYEPEGDPEGFLTVRFYSLKNCEESCGLQINQFLGEFKTRDKEEFIRVIETFMFTNALPF